MTKTQIALLVLGYLFLFEVALQMKLFGMKEATLPQPFKLQHTAWMKFSHVLGIVMSKIILTILWIVGIGPYAIVWKLLHLKKPKRESYWVEVSDENASMKYSF